MNAVFMRISSTDLIWNWGRQVLENVQMRKLHSEWIWQLLEDILVFCFPLNAVESVEYVEQLFRPS